MLAIPLDNENSTTLCELYGRAPYFALLDMQSGFFKVIPNDVVGKGPESAEFLEAHSVTSTIYYHMGEGVYKGFADCGMSVYSAEHQKMSINEIYIKHIERKLTLVDESNYKEKLDPGEGATCTCGCEKK